MIREAKLAVQIQQSDPPRPTGVCVMIGRKVIAAVKIVELRRVLLQIDRLEQTAAVVDQAEDDDNE